jgi:hypothetical protein
MLLPRLTTSQRLAILSPATGLLVFDTDKRTIYMYDGAQWLAMLFAANTLTGQTASNTTTDDYLGNTAAISGDYAVVGATGKTVNTHLYQGSAYIFKRNGTAWQQMQELAQGDGAEGDLFGYSVAIKGTDVVVGAYHKTVGANAMQGAAYVFKLSSNTWSMVKKLTAIGGQANDHFGTSVSISGDTVVVGAPDKFSDPYSNAGGAYIFTNNGGTWNQIDLTASDKGSGDKFGMSVAINSGLIAIGAPGKNSFYPYYYSNGNWLPIPKQTATGLILGDAFGSSLAIGVNNMIVAGAPNTTINGKTNQGAVYVFSPNNTITWPYIKISANDGVAEDYFGSRVAIDGDNIIVGASNKTINQNTLQGAAYLLTNISSVWQQQKIIAGDGAASDYFANGVGISGNYIVIGAPGKNNNSGSVYFLDKTNL